MPALNASLRSFLASLARVQDLTTFENLKSSLETLPKALMAPGSPTGNDLRSKGPAFLPAHPPACLPCVASLCCSPGTACYEQLAPIL